MKNNKLYIVGIGPGHKDLVCPAVGKIIEQGDIIIGGRRNLQLFSHLKKEKLVIGNNLEDIYGYIEKNIESKVITVLVSGDPGIYSIMEYLKSRLNGYDLVVLPGISSMQYLCAKMNISWNDAEIVSLHGREQEDLISIIRNNKKVILFTGGISSPQGIAKEFIKNDLSEVKITVGENLSYQKERIISGKPEDIIKLEFENLSIMLVQNEKINIEPNNVWKYSTPGIPDEMFIRGEIPMTKEEVRAVTISKLRLKEEHIVFDIGAGTGSVSIECGLQCRKGQIYAIEKEEEAIELIKQNVKKFCLDNIQVIEGEAPTILKKMPLPDRIFIGGTCGKFEGMLEWILGMGKMVRVVVNAIAIESVYETIKGFEGKGFTDIDVTSVSVSRGKVAGGKHLMQAFNTIYIISAECGGK